MPAPGMVPAMPAATSGQSATTAASLNNLSNAIIDVVAAPAVIVPDTDQPAGISESSTPARPIGTANYRLPPQSPLYSQLNSTALYGIVESRLQNPLAANPITEARTTVFSASHDDAPLPAALVKKRLSRRPPWPGLPTSRPSRQSRKKPTPMRISTSSHMPKAENTPGNWKPSKPLWPKMKIYFCS